MDEGKAKKSCVPFLRQCFVSAGVCLNILGHGAVIGFSAILIPALRRPESHIHTNTTQESSIASVIGIALLVGNFIMTPLMSTQGRKVCHILAVLPILAGWFVLLLADSVAALVFARFLQGISMGMMGPLGSVIIAETTHPDNRGAFLSTISLSLSIGAFFCHTVGAYLSWQQTALVMSFIPFTSLLLIICAPESPSWLISKGRYAEASSIFYWLRGRGPTEDEELESMITAQNMVKKSSIAGQKVSIRVKIARLFQYINVTFRKPEFYKPITIMLFTFTMFQFSGLNVFNSYALDIIRQVVGPEANAEMLVVAIDLARIVCNFVIIYLTRKFNRRTVLIISGFSCVTCYLTKAVYMYAKVNGKLPEAIAGQWFPTTLLIVYIGLTLGLAVLPFTIGGEVFPLAYRGLAGGISGIPLSVSYFVAVKSFPILNVNIGLSFTYLVYGSIVLVCLIVLCFILPETKGRTLQEIENSFKGLKQTDGTVTQPFMSEYDVDIRRKSSIIIPY